MVIQEAVNAAFCFIKNTEGGKDIGNKVKKSECQKS